MRYVPQPPYQYPLADRVILCERPNGPFQPFFGVEPSASASRIDALAPNWRDRALGVNLWPAGRDEPSGHRPRLGDIVMQTHCRIIVACGIVVRYQMGLRNMSTLSWTTLTLSEHRIEVLAFPHPSGRNRFWNHPEATELARKALVEALFREI